MKCKIGLYKNAKPLCETSNDPGNSSYKRCSYINGALCKEGDGAIPGMCGFDHIEDRDLLEGLEYGCNNNVARKEFGNLPRACSEGPMRFGHAYICDQDMLTSDEYSVEVGDLLSKFGDELSETQAQLEEYGYGPNDRICVFKPKVQVLDNWGWCNGTCGGENGCYGSGLGNEEPGNNQCDGQGDGSDPWTEYNGYIIIAPEQ